MREHIDADEPFVREDVSTDAALDRFRSEGQDYKVELIDDLVSENGVRTVSLYTNGPFTDLCRGPHAPSTKRIKAFKLQSVAGAYWRGDSSKPMLTRVYGTAFFSPKDLQEYLERIERAATERPPPARAAARAVHVLRRRAGLGLLASRRHRGVQLARGAEPRDGTHPRLHRGQDPAAIRQLAVEDLRPLGQVPRQHVRDRVRGPGDGAQADELPGALPAVLAAAPLLPGPAGALLRARVAAPPRAQRDAARTVAGAALRPGRRPHLLHRGPDPAGGRRLPGVRVRDVRRVRHRRQGGAFDAARGADWLGRAVGRLGGGAGQRARVTGPRVRPQRGRRRVLRTRRSTCT